MRSQDGARNPWSAPTTELWAPTGVSRSILDQESVRDSVREDSASAPSRQVNDHGRVSGTHTVANAFAERWIGTLRRELLDRTIIWNRRQLNKLVVDYIDHYRSSRTGPTVRSISDHSSPPTLQTSQIDTSKS